MILKEISKEETLLALFKEFNIKTVTNSTTHFLVPTVLLDSQTGKALHLSFLKKYGFINAYIEDWGIEPSNFKWYNKKDCYIYMLFAPKDFTFNFLEVEDVFKGIKSWVDYYDLDGGGNLIVHVFKVGDKFKEDYIKFTDSKFSQLSNGLKELYINKLSVGIVDKNKYAREIMGKQYGIDFVNEFKNHELLSRIKYEEESLRY